MSPSRVVKQDLCVPCIHSPTHGTTPPSPVYPLSVCLSICASVTLLCIGLLLKAGGICVPWNTLVSRLLAPKYGERKHDCSIKQMLDHPPIRFMLSLPHLSPTMLDVLHAVWNTEEHCVTSFSSPRHVILSMKALVLW